MTLLKQWKDNEWKNYQNSAVKISVETWTKEIMRYIHPPNYYYYFFLVAEFLF